MDVVNWANNMESILSVLRNRYRGKKIVQFKNSPYLTSSFQDWQIEDIVLKDYPVMCATLILRSPDKSKTSYVGLMVEWEFEVKD